MAMLLPSGNWDNMPCSSVLPFLCEEKLYGGATLVAQVMLVWIRNVAQRIVRR